MPPSCWSRAPAVEHATIETFVFGDHAWRQGMFRIDGPGDGWLIHRDTWNSNAPPSATDAAPTDAASDEPA